MKTKLIALALCTAAATTGLYAQQSTTAATQATIQQPQAGDKAVQRTADMVTELGLTAEQTPKVEAINGRYAKSMSDLKAAGLDEQAQKVRASALRDGRDHDLKGVLTAEQYEKMLTLRKEKKAEGMQQKQNAVQHTE
ncbi:MAG: hypothetical protein ABI432_15925 [Flavobacteriales bacterium]